MVLWQPTYIFGWHSFRFVFMCVLPFLFEWIVDFRHRNINKKWAIFRHIIHNPYCYYPIKLVLSKLWSDSAIGGGSTFDCQYRLRFGVLRDFRVELALNSHENISKYVKVNIGVECWLLRIFIDWKKQIQRIYTKFKSYFSWNYSMEIGFKFVTDHHQFCLGI